MFKYTTSLTPAVPKPACHAASILPSAEVKASSENFDPKNDHSVLRPKADWQEDLFLNGYIPPRKREKYDFLFVKENG